MIRFSRIPGCNGWVIQSIPVRNSADQNLKSWCEVQRYAPMYQVCLAVSDALSDSIRYKPRGKNPPRCILRSFKQNCDVQPGFFSNKVFKKIYCHFTARYHLFMSLAEILENLIDGWYLTVKRNAIYSVLLTVSTQCSLQSMNSNS